MHNPETIKSNVSNLEMLKKRKEKSNLQASMYSTLRTGSAAASLCKTDKIRDMYGSKLREEQPQPSEKVVRKK